MGSVPITKFHTQVIKKKEDLIFYVLYTTCLMIRQYSHVYATKVLTLLNRTHLILVEQISIPK